MCSVGVGFSRSASDGEVNAYLDFKDHLNVARIYFSDEIDSDEPSFYVDEETLVNLKGISDSKLNGLTFLVTVLNDRINLINFHFKQLI